MKKNMLLFALLAFVLGGCSAGQTGEINTLQTQVAVLSQSGQTAGAEAADYITAQSDESAFILGFTEKLAAKGWTVSNISENTFGITTPNGGIYLIQYDYETDTVSRVMIYSIWTGIGTSNLEEDVLSIVNQANDEQFLAKISVDPEGDFWLETMVTFGNQLDVNFFCRYLEWFEDNEMTILLNYFQDYLKQ